MTLSPGTKLGRYEIRAELGAGGMGQVYLAHDTSELNRTVAIKLLPPEVAADSKRMQRFIQEARTVSALNHPNVLTIYEFGQEGGTRFIVTEYVEGVTLREHLRAHRLKLHEVLDVATQVAAALDAAHEARVVHRDIKPDNIEHNQVSLTRTSLALALCGDIAQANSLVDELTKQYPQFTLVTGIWLPPIRAALELDRANAAQAVTELEAASRYEAAGEFWPQYIRGLGNLKLGKSVEAAVEFHKIVDHRGQAPLSPLYPLAHLGLARAAALQGDAATARKNYQDFFAFWKDAVADIPVLMEAKKEYEKLN